MSNYETPDKLNKYESLVDRLVGQLRKWLDDVSEEEILAALEKAKSPPEIQEVLYIGNKSLWGDSSVADALPYVAVGYTIDGDPNEMIYRDPECNDPMPSDDEATVIADRADRLAVAKGARKILQDVEKTQLNLKRDQINLQRQLNDVNDRVAEGEEKVARAKEHLLRYVANAHQWAVGKLTGEELYQDYQQVVEALRDVKCECEWED